MEAALTLTLSLKKDTLATSGPSFVLTGWITIVGSDVGEIETSSVVTRAAESGFSGSPARANRQKKKSVKKQRASYARWSLAASGKHDNSLSNYVSYYREKQKHINIVRSRQICTGLPPTPLGCAGCHRMVAQSERNAQC